MNIVMRLFVSLVVALPLLGAGTVSAMSFTQLSEKANIETSSREAETSDESTSEDSTARQKRLERRKTERQIKLSNAEQKRLQDRCQNAQGKLSSLKGRIKGIETSRGQVYDNLVSRLTKFNDKLTAQNIDTTELQAEIANLQVLIATFKTDLEAYKVTVSDLAAMDCKTDPGAFKASLEVARSARQQVVADATAIKTLVNDTIKPTLNALRLQVEKTKPEQGEEN